MGILFVPMFVAGLLLASYLLYTEVLRENTYLSRTIEVQENQKVLEDGLAGYAEYKKKVKYRILPLIW